MTLRRLWREACAEKAVREGDPEDYIKVADAFTHGVPLRLCLGNSAVFLHTPTNTLSS
jgi:hypothetical protein